LFEKNLPSNTVSRIKIPVTTRTGDILIPCQNIQNCFIPETVTTSSEYFADVEIYNNSSTDINFTMLYPIESTPVKDNFHLYNATVHDINTNINIQIDDLIRTDHMNSEEKNELLKLCRKYKDIFYIEKTQLSFTNQIKHQIKTSDENPVFQKSYRYPFIHKQEVQNQINEMLNQNIIRPSSSPWSSPIWIVPKKADASGKKKWRIVVDFRKLNNKTTEDRYPIPNINDILDKLGKCNYFSTIDMKSGFHQIEMCEEDIPKTAFNVENGHFEFVRMPFGLKNAPATFQRVMDNVLNGLQNEICLVYLDDVIVFSTSLQEHIVNLRQVFQRLREANLKIQLEKSEFLKKETAYLGHIIKTDGIKPNPGKILCIKNFPMPKTKKEIKSFLGLLGYYRKFVPNFADVTKPLTNCLKKNSKINFNSEYCQCFENCKNLLLNEPILKYPDFSEPFNLSTDASQVAIGAILSQGKPGQDRPIAYASRTLNDAESKYSTIEPELLAIVWATKYFRPYLYGRKFLIYSDHKPLLPHFLLKNQIQNLRDGD
jgi:hypothetical protein